MHGLGRGSRKRGTATAPAPYFTGRPLWAGWAGAMADLLVFANRAAQAARAAGAAAVDAATLAEIVAWYRGATSGAGPRLPRTGCGWPAGLLRTRT
jgi:hypothetical protein